MSFNYWEDYQERNTDSNSDLDYKGNPCHWYEKKGTGEIINAHNRTEAAKFLNCDKHQLKQIKKPNK